MPRLNRSEINRINLTINKIVVKLGKNSVKFFKKNWRKGGQQDRTFKKWAALKSNTVRMKRRAGQDKGILRRTDRLLNSLKVLSASRNRVKIGTTTPYGQYHQNPNFAPSPPTRPFLYNSDDLNKENEKIINEQLLKLFKIVK